MKYCQHCIIERIDQYFNYNIINKTLNWKKFNNELNNTQLHTLQKQIKKRKTYISNAVRSILYFTHFPKLYAISLQDNGHY